VEEIMARCDIAEWVVTAGAGGGCIHTRKGRRYVYRSAKAPAAADPTGAGDVFLAAYAAARWGGRPPESAARAASAAAARHMAGGAIPSGLLDLPGLRPSRSPAGRNCVDNEPNER
jgi:sugar/nucleoside kinase (ribokinase family)